MANGNIGTTGPTKFDLNQFFPNVPGIIGGGTGLPVQFPANFQGFKAFPAIQQKLNQQIAESGQGGVIGGAQQAGNLAVQNLLDLLTGGPNQQLFNQQLTQIARGGQGTQQLIRDMAAQAGPGVGAQSGVTQALQAAAAQGTQGQLAQARAQQTEADRRRQLQVLEMFISLILGPQIQREGIQAGVGIAGRQTQAQERGALIGAGAGLIPLAFGGGSSAAASQLLK